MVFSYQLIIMIFSFIVHAQAVTVGPSLCPTNKIAPHRRAINWDRRNARTLGAFYDLLAPNGNGAPGFPRPPQNSLLEESQQDDADDCGEIDDYDENDLSSLTSSQRRQGESRLFFSGLIGQNQGQQRPPHVQFPQPQRPPYPQPDRPPYPRPDRPQYPQPGHPQNPAHQQPQRPQYPPQYPHPSQGAPRPPRPNYPPARPPYASGGFFSNNPYRPPAQQYPSDNIKPVHENDSEAHMIYRPDLVGGPSGHVVGATPVRPPQRPSADDPRRDYYNRHQQRLSQAASERRERPRRLNSNGSIVGSFIDLLFK